MRPILFVEEVIEVGGYQEIVGDPIFPAIEYLTVSSSPSESRRHAQEMAEKIEARRRLGEGSAYALIALEDTIAELYAGIANRYEIGVVTVGLMGEKGHLLTNYKGHINPATLQFGNVKTMLPTALSSFFGPRE